MLRIAKSANLFRCLSISSTRFLSGVGSGDDFKGSVNVDKLIGFFKQAGEKLAKEAEEKLIKETEDKLTEEVPENSSIESAKRIAEATASVVQEHTPSKFPTSGSESTPSGPLKMVIYFTLLHLTLH